MKTIQKILLLALLISADAYKKGVDKLLVGEWTLELANSCDTPDLIIFRSDNKYLIFNDMDFVGMEETDEFDKSNVHFDIEGVVTALVETGNWVYEPITRELTLSGREFLKKYSLFSNFHGKEARLLFKIEGITDKELILRSLNASGSCDGYIKNYNPNPNRCKAIIGDIIFYKDVAKIYSGIGTTTTDLFLSGYETELKLNYQLQKSPGKIVLENRKGEELFSTEMEITNGVQTKQIPLRGVTRLIIKVICTDPGTKWNLEVDIK